jgi:methionyl-tRNA formyltransferase
VRAFNPWPAAFTVWQGQQIKLLRAQALSLPAIVEPGRVDDHNGAIVVTTGDGLLRLDEVQLAGRAAMAAQDFARGQRSFLGSRLG